MKYLDTLQKWQNTPTRDKLLKNGLKRISKKRAEKLFSQKIQYTEKGLSAKVAPGTNKINEFTIAGITKAFAEYILDNAVAAKTKGVVICFDNRANGELYTDVAARVLNNLGIKVYLFKSNNIQPSPLLSYAIKKLKAAGGIDITSTIEDSSFNGFQAFDKNGFKLNKANAKKLNTKLQKVNFLTVEQKDFEPKYINDEIINDFISDILISRDRKKDQKKIKITISTLHGSTYEIAPKILQKMDVSYKTVKKDLKISERFGKFDFKTNWNIRHITNVARKNNSDIIFILNSNGTNLCVLSKTKLGHFEIMKNDTLMAIIMNYKKQFGNFKDTLIGTEKTSKLIEDLANRHGMKFIESDTYNNVITDVVGLNKLTSAMALINDKDIIYANKFITSMDGLHTMVLITEIANYLKTQNQTLSSEKRKIIRMLGHYHRSKKVFKNIEEKTFKKLINKLEKRVAYPGLRKKDVQKINEFVYKINFQNGTWMVLEWEQNKLNIEMEIKSENRIHTFIERKEVFGFIKEVIKK